MAGRHLSHNDDHCDSCLYLFLNSEDNANTQDSKSEIIPIATQQRRFAERTRDLLHYSPRPSPSTLSTSSNDGKPSKRSQLPLPTRTERSSQSPLQSSLEILQSAIPSFHEHKMAFKTNKNKQQSYNPGASSAFVSNNQNEQSFVGREVQLFDHTTITDRKNSMHWSHYASNSSWADRQYQGGAEILPSTTYNPEDLLASAPSSSRKDYSEAMGIPSPTYPDERSMTLPVHHSQKPIHNAGLETLIRSGLYSPESNINQRHNSVNLTPIETDFSAKIQEVNVGCLNVYEAHADASSLYAEVFAANPFGIDLSPGGDADLSMKATLFPSHNSPVLDSFQQDNARRPTTPNSYNGSDSSGHSSESSVGGTTKDFHRALSSIAKDKSTPVAPAFGYSAKAMSLLGQSNPAGDCNTAFSNSRSKIKPAASQPSNFVNNKKEDQPRVVMGLSQKQQLKDVLSALTKSNAEAAAARPSKSIIANHPSKVDSILGINIPASNASIYLPPPVYSDHGPRTSSTLYRKLYNQVSKPCASDNPMSSFAGSSYNCSNGSPYDEDNEPVKKSSVSTQKTTLPSYGFPISPASSTNTWSHKDSHRSAQVSPLIIAKKRTEEHSSSDTSYPSFTSDATNTAPPERSNSVGLNGHRSGPTSTLAFSRGHKSLRAHAEYDIQDIISVADHRFTFQDMAVLSDNLRQDITSQHASLLYAIPNSTMDGAGHRGNAGTDSNQCNSAPQDFAKAIIAAHASSNHYEADFRPPVSFQADVAKREASMCASDCTIIVADQDSPIKRPKSPVKKMFSSTVEKIGRMLPTGNILYTSSLSNVIPTATELKISIHPADQNRLYGDLEYIIQDTANRFLLYQHSHGRLSSHSIEKVAKGWFQKNRPRVAQFLYPISIQRELVSHNLDTITFHGPLAGNALAITSIMQTWKYVAGELSVRSFCLPDAGLQHFLREAQRLLELLGVAAGHMLHFQAWCCLVQKTVHSSYHIPYSNGVGPGRGDGSTGL